MQFISSVWRLETQIRRIVGPSLILANGKINEEILWKSANANKQAIATWLGTAMDLLSKVIGQMEGTMKMGSVILLFY